MTLAGARLSDREIEAALQTYAGLIHETARMLVEGRPPYDKGLPIEEDLEDVVQILYLKAWRAIRAFDPSRWKGGQATRHASHAGKSARDRYVNMCVRDQAKDILKRKRRGDLYIEDVAPARTGNTADDVGSGGLRDAFEQRYLSHGHDDIYGEVDDGDVPLPNTLSRRELDVLALMRQHFKQTEIAAELGVTKREVETAVRSIRTKLADWRPGSATTAAQPVPA